MAAQKPIELIHARNLITSIATPAFLVDADATLVFYNDAASVLVGRRYEETGTLPAERWVEDFGPVDDEDDPVALDELPMTLSLRRNRPAHGRFCIHSVSGEKHRIETSAIPIEGADGFRGAIAFFWPVDGADSK